MNIYWRDESSWHFIGRASRGFTSVGTSNPDRGVVYYRLENRPQYFPVGREVPFKIVGPMYEQLYRAKLSIQPDWEVKAELGRFERRVNASAVNPPTE